MGSCALLCCFVQLLWVNLIMDTMGALALATEDPNPALLDEKVGLQELLKQEGLETKVVCREELVSAHLPRSAL